MKNFDEKEDSIYNPNPLNELTPTVRAEYEKSAIEYQIRFERELEIDAKVSSFLSKIIQAYLSFFGDNKSIQLIFKGHEEYDYFTTEPKIKKYYRILHPFLAKYSTSMELLSLLVEIYDIYTDGGLDKVSDAKLNDLDESLTHYLTSGLPIPIKD
jgi:hypothetical protein